MGWSDSLNYVLFSNPLSSGVISTASNVAKAVGVRGKPSAASAVMPPVLAATKSLYELAGANRQFIRIAGLSGVCAVVLGAYGTHRSYPPTDGAELKAVFDTANRFHFLHSIALLAVPLTRQPMITGLLMIIGTTLFSGVCYYRALTGNRQFNQLAPIGSVCLLFAWASMVI